MTKKLSILLYFDMNDESQVRKCLDSIVSSRELLKEMQIVLLHPEGVEAARECMDYVAEKEKIDFLLPNVIGMEEVQAYNIGLALAEGEFISFMLSSSYFGKKALRFSMKKIQETGEKLFSLRPKYCGEEGNAGDYPAVPETGGEKDASKIPDDVQMNLHAYIAARQFFEGNQFDEELHEEACFKMVLELLLKNEGKFYYEQEQEYCYTTPLENDWNNCVLSEHAWWYEDSVKNFLIPFMEKMQTTFHGKVPKYIQRSVYYLTCAKYYCNLGGHDKLLMDEQKVGHFFDLCFQLFQYIDNDIIFQKYDFSGLKIPRVLCTIFLRGKAVKLGYHSEITEQDGKSYCNFIDPKTNSIVDKICVGDVREENFEVKVINYKNGYLEIDAFCKIINFLQLSGKFDLYGEIGGKPAKRVEVTRSSAYDLLKCFGVTYARKCAVHVKVPVQDLLQSEKGLAFYIQTPTLKQQLPFLFGSMSSRLLSYSQKSYWRFDHDQYMLTRSGNRLFVQKSSGLLTLKKELLYLAVLLIQKNHKESFSSVLLRLRYWLTRPYFKRKRIWITFDKLYKGGDNGEYFFQYCQKQKDGIDCYYVINRDAPDCERLKKQYPRRIIYANSNKCRLMALHAEAIMATHAGATTYLGFPGSRHKYFKNIYQGDNICIQHGLSIQRIAHFQNRLYANTKLYCCASPYEVENVARPIYGYAPEMLKLTGLARYDGLRNNEKKQILITPTWRKGLVHTKGVGMKNNHNALFKETAYYKIYNSLINDQQLISCAKEFGYGIVFLLHPAMSAQMEDYDKNEYVKIVQATGDMSYEKILTESSLMVTDYSGVQFDFAYQRKPVLYYHPDALPPHYTEGGLIYDTMGFGPICKEHGELVENLCEYMQNGCRMKKEYKERADKFFAYDDFNNCERIYQEILQFKRKR